MSGEVYAAAKASTCCDAAGEEYPKGRWGNNTPMSEDDSLFYLRAQRNPQEGSGRNTHMLWVYEALIIAQISGLSCGFVLINFMYAKTPSGVLGVFVFGFCFVSRREGDQYMPSMPPAGIAGAGVGSLMSVTRASVVSRVDATDAAFCRALLVTLVGSRMPCLIMSQ